MLRRYILAFLLVFAHLLVYAQGSYNYSKFGIGIFGSLNRPYADLNIAKDNKTYNITGYYNLTPYVPIGLEFQIGELAGGSIISDPDKRQYDNKYKAVVLHGDFFLGEVIDYEGSFFMGLVKDLYVGTGVGIINNNMAFIQRTNLIPNAAYPVGTYRFPGKDKSMSLMIPIRFGYEFKIYNAYDEPFIGLNVGYVHNMTFGENLDGYNDPSSGFKNNSPDQYRQIVVGIKINFGGVVPYTKQINTY